MYPTISDLINDLFGINIPLPIQMFGFMLAVSFLLASYTLQLELMRKEKEGLLKPFEVKSLRGAKATFADYLGSFITGFIVGWKLIFIVQNYSLFVQDTQMVLLSMTGSITGGIAVGIVMLISRYYESEKNKLPEVKEVVEQMYPHQMVVNLTFVAAIWGVLGAKIFHNLENWDELVQDPIDALLSFSGLTMYGGLILGATAVIIYAKRYGIGALKLSDATAPGLMLAYGTGRIGCHLSGDGDWGIINLSPKPSFLSWLPDWFWSYNYPNNVINHGIPIPGCEGNHCMMLPDAVFPTPLYEAIMCIILFFVLWSIRKKIKIPGVLFCSYLILNGIERFLIEQIRVNNKFDFWGIVATQAEIIACLLVFIGAVGAIFLTVSNKSDNVNAQ